MSLATVRNRVDNWLTPRWQTLVDRQETFLANRGQYFQGMWTHSGDVTQTDALSGDQVADQLTEHPTDQAQHWRDFIGNALDAVPFPARLRIDVYNGPQGQGWQATFEVLYNGNRYRRTQNSGPETWRTQGWQRVGE